jgi:hypothetical protein
MSLTKLSLGRNYDVIWESGDGDIEKVYFTLCFARGSFCSVIGHVGLTMEPFVYLER